MEQQSVDKSEQLHRPLVLSQVLMSLQQKHKLSAVLPVHLDLPRPLLGPDDGDQGAEVADAYGTATDGVCPWDT